MAENIIIVFFFFVRPIFMKILPAEKDANSIYGKHLIVTGLEAYIYIFIKA